VERVIGFIGLGRMGRPMASHLVQAGFKVFGWDSDPKALETFCSSTASAAPISLRQLGRESDVVITMLPTSKIVRDLMLGVNGELGLEAFLRAGTIVIDMGTSDPYDTRTLGGELAKNGIHALDAPVAGGVVFAENGTLDVLVAGERSVIDAVEPLLMAMGRSVTYCGCLGAAHAMKALINYVNAAVMSVNLEALVAGVKFGIDQAALIRSVEAATTGRNHPLEKKIKAQVLTGTFASKMALGLIAKDLNVARDVIERQGLRGPIVRCLSEVWKEAADEIGFEGDQTEIVRFWENAAGLTVRWKTDPTGKAS
jgi:3-hydroxyisobutyrate dehydrogenase